MMPVSASKDLSFMRKRSFIGLVVGTVLLVWGCGQGKGQAAAPPAAVHDESPSGTDPHSEGDAAGPHADAGGGEGTGTIALSPEARANIGLTVESAQLRPIERTLTLNATLEVIPDQEAFVSSRVQGKVTEVQANVGDRVARGQPLVLLQSLQIAEAPPVVAVPSPLDGVVLERTVTVGETIDPVKSLFHIGNLARMLAGAEVFEADLALVRRGQVARVRVLPYPERMFMGRVVRLSDAIDPQRRTLRIWIEVPNTADLKLKPQMFAQVNLVVSSGRAAVTVPNEAVQVNGPERFVFVQNGEGFLRQNVILGERDDRYTAIKSGLVEGDEVVVRGAVELATVAAQPAGGGVQDESKPHSH